MKQLRQQHQYVSEFYRLDGRLKSLEKVLFEKSDQKTRVNEARVIRAYGRYSRQLTSVFDQIEESLRAALVAFKHDLRQQVLALDDEEIACEFDVLVCDTAARFEEFSEVKTEWQNDGRAVTITVVAYDSLQSGGIDNLVDRFLNALEQKARKLFGVVRCKIKEQRNMTIVELTLARQTAPVSVPGLRESAAWN